MFCIFPMWILHLNIVTYVYAFADEYNLIINDSQVHNCIMWQLLYTHYYKTLKIQLSNHYKKTYYSNLPSCDISFYQRTNLILFRFRKRHSTPLHKILPKLSAKCATVYASRVKTVFITSPCYYKFLNQTTKSCAVENNYLRVLTGRFQSEEVEVSQQIVM